MNDILNHLNGKDVSIFINSSAATGEPEKDKISFFTDGTYMHRGNMSSVIYEESDVSGLPGTRTMLTISPRGVSLTRRGTVTSFMSFHKGEREQCPMNTPYGSFMVKVNTIELNHDFNENGGKLYMHYDMEYEHKSIGSRTFEMEVKTNNPN